jgi:hypothetical protein
MGEGSSVSRNNVNPGSVLIHETFIRPTNFSNLYTDTDVRTKIVGISC